MKYDYTAYELKELSANELNQLKIFLKDKLEHFKIESDILTMGRVWNDICNILEDQKTEL